MQSWQACDVLHKLFTTVERVFSFHNVAPREKNELLATLRFASYVLRSSRVCDFANTYLMGQFFGTFHVFLSFCTYVLRCTLVQLYSCTIIYEPNFNCNTQTICIGKSILKDSLVQPTNSNLRTRTIQAPHVSTSSAYIKSL